MQKITILGLAVAISMMSCTVSVAEAEPIPSPYQQVRDGTPVGEVVCAGDRMLMLSPSGEPACVFASSVDALVSRGFVLVSEAVPDAFKTGDRPFVTTWRTASPNESITIPVGSSTGAYTVDWGDGTVTSVTGNASHAYASPGEHQVVISGDFTRIYLNGRPNAEKLQSIDQWGDIQWESMNSAFEGATNMVYRANDAPNLSNVTDMSKMFLYADSFNGDLSDWDVSSVTDMYEMFADASSFNGDISPWDVSSVTDMYEMFADASSFSGDLSDWDVSGVTGMSHMFSGAGSFNSDLSPWDVSGVADMSQMFLDADSFTQNLGSWYITLDGTPIDDGDAARTVGNISAQNSFLGDQNPTYGIGVGGDSELFELDGTSLKLKTIPNHLTKESYTVNITATGTFGTNNFHIFDIAVSEGAAVSPLDSYASNLPTAYTDFITTWETTQSGETVTIHVGRSTGAYTVDWGDGTVTSVTGDASHAYANPGVHQVVISGDFTRIYLNGSPNAEKLQSIDQWGDIQWESMNLAFEGATNMVYRATDVPDLSGVTDMYAMFAYADSFNGDISEWDVSGVTDMSAMFAYATSFNGDISEWNVSDVTDMPWMLNGADSFNGDISEWDVSGVTDMSSMFSDADSFNGDISEWDVSGVTRMFGMFANTDSFNGDLSGWDVSGVTDMSKMFLYADSFNGDLSGWDVSGVTRMYAMFAGADSFNGDLSGWDVSSVTNMDRTFDSASSFNGDISEWDVSDVARMSWMFSDADSFNGDISEWDVSGVTYMYAMFTGASSFNGDISEWDVSSVTDMSEMFAGADSFNGDISPWDISGVTDMSEMFAGADSFTQNLGSWYITLDGTSTDDGDATRAVGNISAQNSFLGGQSLRYSIAPGGDGDAFEIDGTVLKLKSTPNHTGKSSYTVTISSTGGFGTSNSETFEIRVV